MNRETLIKELTRIAKEYRRHHPWDGIHTVCEAAIEEINCPSEKDRSEETYSSEKDRSDVDIFAELANELGEDEEDLRNAFGVLAEKIDATMNTQEQDIFDRLEKIRNTLYREEEYDPSNLTFRDPVFTKILEDLELVYGGAAKLVQDRDSARRHICRMESSKPKAGWDDHASRTTPEAIAKKKGWDCYGWD